MLCLAVNLLQYSFYTEEHQALKHPVRHCEVCFRRCSSCRVEHAFSDYQRFSTEHLLIYSCKQLWLMFTQMSEKKWGILYFKYKTNSKSWTTSTKWGREKFSQIFFCSHTYRASWYYGSFLLTNWCTTELSSNNFKIYIKIYIKTVSTCFGAVTPSSGNALLVLAKVTLVKTANYGTSVSCFSVSYNVNFKIV